MSHLLEKHKIEFLDELENLANSSEHYHSVQLQGDIKYSLSSRLKSFPHVSDIDSFSDISESEISDPFFDNPPMSLLDSSLNNCEFSLDPHLSLWIYSSLHNYDLEACLKPDIHVIE